MWLSLALFATLACHVAAAQSYYYLYYSDVGDCGYYGDRDDRCAAAATMLSLDVCTPITIAGSTGYAILSNVDTSQGRQVRLTYYDSSPCTVESRLPLVEVFTPGVCLFYATAGIQIVAQAPKCDSNTGAVVGGIVAALIVLAVATAGYYYRRSRASNSADMHVPEVEPKVQGIILEEKEAEWETGPYVSTDMVQQPPSYNVNAQPVSIYMDAVAQQQGGVQQQPHQPQGFRQQPPQLPGFQQQPPQQQGFQQQPPQQPPGGFHAPPQQPPQQPQQPAAQVANQFGQMEI